MNLKTLTLCAFASTLIVFSCRKNNCGEPTANRNIDQDSIALNITFHHAPPGYGSSPTPGGKIDAAFTIGRNIYQHNGGYPFYTTTGDYVDMNNAVYFNGSAMQRQSKGYYTTTFNQQSQMTIEWVDANCRRYTNSFSYEMIEIPENFDTIPLNGPFTFIWDGPPAREGEKLELWLDDERTMHVHNDVILSAGDTSGVFDFSSYTSIIPGQGSFRIARIYDSTLQDSTSAGGQISVTYRSDSVNVTIQ